MIESDPKVAKRYLHAVLRDKAVHDDLVLTVMQWGPEVIAQLAYRLAQGECICKDCPSCNTERLESVDLTDNIHVFRTARLKRTKAGVEADYEHYRIFVPWANVKYIKERKDERA